MMLVRLDQHVSSMSSTWEPTCCFFPAILMSIHVFPRRTDLVFDEQTDIPQFGTLSHPSSNRTSSKVSFPTRGQQASDRTKFRSTRITKSSMFDHDLGHFVSWKTYPHFWTLWLWTSEQFGSILHLYLSVCWYGISCLSVSVKWSHNDVHYFCWCHLRRWRSLFCKYCSCTWVDFYCVTPKHDSSYVLTPHSWDYKCPSM